MEEEQLVYRPEKKKLLSFGLPYQFRWPLLWTLFFAILGLVIQIVNKQVVWPNLWDFFGKNFIDFFRIFGNFTNAVTYPTEMDVIRALVGNWYYFFYTGGLISLIWTTLSSIINFELDVTKKIKYKDSPSKEELQKMEEAQAKSKQETEIRKKLEMLIMRCENFVNIGNKEEARKTYEEIKLIYTPDLDEEKKYFTKILAVYNKIVV